MYCLLYDASSLLQVSILSVATIMMMLYRKTSGYRIEKDDERSMSLELDREIAEDDTLSEHDFERSSSPELQKNANLANLFFSGSETEVR